MMEWMQPSHRFTLALILTVTFALSMAHPGDGNCLLHRAWRIQVMATVSHQDVKHAFPIANQTTHATAGSCSAGNLKKMDVGIYCAENAVAAPSVAALNAATG